MKGRGRTGGYGGLCKHIEKGRGKSAKPSCYGLVCYNYVQQKHRVGFFCRSIKGWFL